MKLPTPALLLSCLGLAACDPITMGLMTAGGGVAVNHQMSSTITRTFSETSGDVHSALLVALDHMSISVKTTERRGEVETIHAVAGAREVTMRVEPVTRTSTLLEVAVHQDLLTMDGATAREIVAQTEHSLPAVDAAIHTRSSTGQTVPRATQRAGSTIASTAPTGRTTYYGVDSEHPAKPADPARAHERAAKTGSKVIAHGAKAMSGRTATGRADSAEMPLNPNPTRSPVPASSLDSAAPLATPSGATAGATSSHSSGTPQRAAAFTAALP
jgi:hypothetical protein